MEFLSFLVLLASTASCALSARIAGFVGPEGSHYITMKNIMVELGSRGHEAVLVVPSTRKVKASDKVTHKFYQVPFESEFVEKTVVKYEIEGNKLKLIWHIANVMGVIVESFFNSTELLKELEEIDLIVYDCMSYFAVLFGELHDIPRVEILPISPNAPFSRHHLVPMPVSYAPQFVTGFSDKMTFLQRVINLGVYVVMGVAEEVFLVSNSMNKLKVKHNIKPERRFTEAVGEAELLIISADFALEYPQPLLPGQIMVGPLNVQTPKPLPPDLEEFVSSSGGNGFIIVSFGSNVASALPNTEIDTLAKAFGKLKQRVVWRWKGYIPPFLNSNIKIVAWLPQNDLLGHKDIKAFVSHVGHNSYYESAYHGVPLVACPLYGDQHSNAKKIKHFGLGLAVNHKTVDSQQLFETIEHVIKEPRFKAEASRVSRLLKDSPRTPLEKAGDWIEYVIRHGGAKHLRAQVLNIPWYQYYLLDVMAFLLAIVALLVMVIRLICQCACNLCCRKREHKNKNE